MTVLIEPHYLGSLEYFAVLMQADAIHWDVESPFQKQTFRNRCVLLTANRVMPLIVPVHHTRDTPFREVTIDYRQPWVREHWGAFYSAYGKAPYFEHLAGFFRAVWDSKPETLLELNRGMMTVCLRLLKWQTPVVETANTADIDLRDRILAKNPFGEREFYQPHPYRQNFGSAFVPNLSILDVVLCHGPESTNILRQSVRRPLERFGA
jgi:hypothetical protein